MSESTPHQPKSDVFYLRVTPDFKQALMSEATRFGEPTAVVREVLQAFIDGRITIYPPPNQKESLYNVTRKQD